MMRYLLSIFLLSALFSRATAQNYNVQLIPKELLPYASAVVRTREETIEAKDLDNVTTHIHSAITVLNKNGDDMAHMVLFYNKMRAIKNVKGFYYDEFGKPLGKFSERDFEDEYAGGEENLYVDERVKHYIPAVTTYPYTIEYDCELKDKQTLLFPGWEPQPWAGLAVESSKFIITSKPDFGIRYKELNMPQKAISGTTKDGFRSLTWQVDNLKALRAEPYSPNDSEYLPMVKLAPVKFQYDNFTGSFTNWQQLGQWQYDKLLANRQALLPETVQHIQELTAGITDEKLKARKIYEYMQQKTRYISVQEGIGGYQPFPALDVDRVHYSDCKGLVNYTQALLKAGGIESYFCVVMAGNERISMMPDFASMNQGNHIILCIPFKNDTTWLECTSQHIPFGYLGTFTADRTVLACTPQGGKLLHTPKYTAQESTQIRKASFTLDANGELTGEMNTVFKGAQYENRDEYITEAQFEQLKDIKKEYPINNMDIEKLEFKQDKSLNPVTTEYIKLKAYAYASNDNGHLTFLPNAANRRSSPLRDIRNRRTNVVINEGFTDNDDITYTLPDNYRLDINPLNRHITMPFGSFDAEVQLTGNKLIYKRHLQLKEGTYKKEIYPDMVDFFQSVVDADEYSAVLVKGN